MHISSSLMGANGDCGDEEGEDEENGHIANGNYDGLDPIGEANVDGYGLYCDEQGGHNVDFNDAGIND